MLSAGAAPRNWLAGQRVTGVQGSSGFVLAVVHLPLCWLLVQQMGYLGAAVATSMGELFAADLGDLQAARLVQVILHAVGEADFGN